MEYRIVSTSNQKELADEVTKLLSSPAQVQSQIIGFAPGQK